MAIRKLRSEAELVHESVIEAARGVNINHMNLGGLLCEVIDKEHWRTLRRTDGEPFLTFIDYATHTLGYCASHISRLVKTARTFAVLKYDIALTLPMKHMHKLAYIVNQENVQFWLMKCQGKTAREVELMIREHLGGPLRESKRGRPSKKEAQLVFTAHLSSEDSVDIEEALTLLRKTGEVATRGEALGLLGRICKGCHSASSN